MLDYKVELLNIHKSFGGIKALDNVSLKARPGEIHAIVGENGAGKSTLMKILSGAYSMDSGRILINGKEARINHPGDARSAGVAIIYQELSLIPDLSVAENIYLHHLRVKRYWMPWKEITTRADELVRRLGFEIPSTAKAGNLSVAQQQIVEIARALSEKVEVLILDEPTAVLAPHETERLFGILDDLKNTGVTIFYISHRLEEIFRIADTITVLKDGLLSANLDAGSASQDELIRHMTGRKLESFYPPPGPGPGEEILKVKDLNAGRLVRDVSFTVRAGEVLGIAGLVGSGRTEMVRALFGADRKDAGEVFLEGRKLNITSPSDAVKAGLGLVPEDRKTQGVLLSMSVKKNLTMSDLKDISGFPGWISGRKETGKAESLIDSLGIRAKSTEQPVGHLSGGNQQKVSLAKWLGRTCRIILMDEPTRGVDVGAKAEIYRLIRELAGKGIGIVMVSSEIPELIGMCDRILSMHEGRISGELEPHEYSEENILRLCIATTTL